ncbi:MAG TPA: cytochrome P460 family protein [Pyrinomonadaceae bacterium]
MPVIGDDKKTSNLKIDISEDVFKVKESIKPLNPGLYGEVYINERAAQAVKEGKFRFTDAENKDAGDSFRFPTGSIIVREKIVVKDKSTVEALAVMIKRESSFNPQADGWQFLYLDPKTLAVTKNDQATCLSCHKEKKDTNFVFNTYQP